jgi:hypothetical protein
MAVDETVAVPLPDPRLKVRVIALLKAKTSGAFRYLQGMRQGTLKAISADPEDTEVARAYHRNEQKYFAMLAEAVPGPIDAVLSPPSRMAWQAEPYRKAIAAAHAEAADLTAAVSRTGNARAGEGASFEDVLDGLSYKPTGQEKNFRRIVIVDDTFTTGTTAAAVVVLLRQHGLLDECEVIFACPLWLDTFAKST